MKIKKRRKALPSSWRIKKRYLLFHAVGEKPLDGRAMAQAIDQALLDAFGSVGAGAFHVAFIRFDPKTQQGILRCRREALADVRSALLFLSQAKTVVIRLDILGISGTIRALLKKSENQQKSA
jgi:ribonuclease P/MRP protein subunit POP5